MLVSLNNVYPPEAGPRVAPLLVGCKTKDNKYLKHMWTG